MKGSKKAPASEKQISTLLRAGYQESELSGLSLSDASALIDRVASNHWRRPREETTIARVPDKELSERAIPALDETALNKLAECLTDYEDIENEEGLRYQLKECLARTSRDFGLILKGYKELYGRQGKWLLLLSALHITERTAYRWMKMGKIDVPAPLAEALEAKAVRLDTRMTKQEERITQVAANRYQELTPMSKTLQPIDSNEVATRAVKEAIEQVTVKRADIQQLAVAESDKKPVSCLLQPTGAKGPFFSSFEDVVVRLQSQAADILMRARPDERRAVLVEAFRRLTNNLHLEAPEVMNHVMSA